MKFVTVQKGISDCCGLPGSAHRFGGVTVGELMTVYNNGVSVVGSQLVWESPDSMLNLK